MLVNVIMVWCSVRETQTEEAEQIEDISSDELNCHSIRLTTLFFLFFTTWNERGLK